MDVSNVAQPIFKSGLDTATVVVSTDDDVRHAEDANGVLNDRQDIHIRVDHEIGDVAVHEDLSWILSNDLVGGHTRITAADPEVARSVRA
eukprot:scaffold58137_cov35-Tisochrysis_lutea.AAC.2